MSGESRTSISPRQRLRIAERDEWRCRLCGAPVPRIKRRWWDSFVLLVAPSIDHVRPVSDGGDNSPNNLQLAHLLCNMRKGNRQNWQPDPAHLPKVWALLEENENPYGVALRSPDDA